MILIKRNVCFRFAGATKIDARTSPLLVKFEGWEVKDRASKNRARIKVETVLLGFTASYCKRAINSAR